MQIDLIFVGKTKEKYLAEGVNDFKRRLGHYCNVKITVLKEKKGKLSEQERLKTEGKSIIDSIPRNSFVILLDRTGKKVCSKELAALIETWQLNYPRITVIIGGFLGVSDEVVHYSNFSLSLSEMTFTHEMTRLLVLEQFYRGFSIIKGTKYHK